MLEIPPRRSKAAHQVAERLRAARSIVVLTHIRGDGDGWGSAAALAHHYGPAGVEVRLLAATPFPDRFRFLLPRSSEPLAPGPEGHEAMATADLQVLVDVNEPSRLGDFAAGLEPSRTLVIDHHPAPSERLGWTAALIDAEAAATVELVHDVLTADGQRPNVATATALYVGLVTDTGSFRYSNVKERTHRLAAELIARGVDPGRLYPRLHGRSTRQELEVLRAALERLSTDPALPISWIALDSEVERRYGELDDYERVLEYARNLEDTQIALMFRDLGDGSVKISLRSNGPADVAAVAREFGGGGHEKAAGALIRGDLKEVKARVLERCRAALRSAASGEDLSGGPAGT